MHIADSTDLDRLFLDSLWPTAEPLHVVLWLEAMLCVAFREAPLLDYVVVLTLLDEQRGWSSARRVRLARA